jgi:ABC-2 type transport system permease protein
MDSPVMAALSGPDRYLADYTYGAMLGHQMLYVTAIAAAIMTVLMVVRHTRAEEESGRAELVRAGVVGRHAHLAAALVVAAAANILLGGLLVLGLSGLGLEDVDLAGSVLFGAAVAAVGLVFAGVAATTAQVTEHTRGASGMALGLLGLAYVLRAVGDAGTGAEVLSWLSPIGWAQRTYVYLDDRWWPLLPAVVLAAVLAVAAVRLSTRRDVGAGLRAPRQGRAGASAALTRPVGFALRLHRGLLIGFGVTGLLVGASYGSIFGDLEEMLANLELADELLGSIDAPPVEAFASVLLVIMAVIVSIYVVLASLRPRAEENAGRVEPVLATGLSRGRWLGSHLVVALAGGTLVMLVTGTGFAAAAAASAADPGLFTSFGLSTLAYAPPLWLTAGLAVALFGWLPRWTALAWLVPAYGFLVGYLGQVLRFPEWLANLSPFGHVPAVPAEELRWTPLVVLTLIAVGLIAVGLIGFRRRDLRSE